MAIWGGCLLPQTLGVADAGKHPWREISVFLELWDVRSNGWAVWRRVFSIGDVAISRNYKSLAYH